MNILWKALSRYKNWVGRRKTVSSPQSSYKWSSGWNPKRPLPGSGILELMWKNKCPRTAGKSPSGKNGEEGELDPVSECPGVLPSPDPCTTAISSGPDKGIKIRPRSYESLIWMKPDLNLMEKWRQCLRGGAGILLEQGESTPFGALYIEDRLRTYM